MPTTKLVHLVPDRLVNTTGAYHYSETVPNVECDVAPATAKALVASGAFHAMEAPPPIATPTDHKAPQNAGPLDSPAVPAEKE
jgi:hypothetical protein